MSFIGSIWERIRPRRRPQESIDLNPVEQLTLRYLLSFGGRKEEDVFTEVSGTRTADRTEVAQALARLVRTGLVETRGAVEAADSETVYYPSSKSSKLRDRIPQDPRGVIEFYL